MVRPFLLVVLVALGFTLIQARFPASKPPAMRLVYASIAVDGVTVLSGSTSDDGHPDVDAVWQFLPSLSFRSAPGLEELGFAPEGDSLFVRGKPDATKGLILPFEPTVQLDIAYGGQVTLREIKLTRGETTATGETWRINPAVVEEQFNRRLITREQARQLKDAKRKR